MAYLKRILFTGALLLLGFGGSSFAQNGQFKIYDIGDATIYVGDDYLTYVAGSKPIKEIRKVQGAGWLRTDISPSRVYGTPLSTGTYHFTISATAGNQISDYDTESFTITVKQNPAPGFTSAPGKTGKENSLYRYNISVEDNDRIDLSVVSKPSFLTFTDNGDGTGRLQGTPGYNHAGRYTIKIKAADNNAVDPKTSIQTYTLTIKNANRKPAIHSQAPTSGKEGTKYSYTIDARDPDRDNLSYGKTSGPGWLSFSGNTLQGTPGYSHAGNYTVKVRVSDGKGGVDTQQYTLTVTDTNRKPNIQSIGKLSGKEGKKFGYSVSAGDPDGDNLSYDKISGPGWLSFAGNNLQGTPGYSDAGSYTVKVQVSDGNGGSDTESFTLAVSNTNRNPQIGSIESQSAKENKKFSYSVSAGDPDGDNLTYGKISGPDWLSFSGNTLQGTPGYSDSGSYTVKIRASDGNGGSDTGSFTLTVSNTNRAPAITSTPPAKVKEGSVYNYVVKATDPDGDSITYSYTEGPDWLSMSGETLSGTPGYNMSGKFTVTVKATDGHAGDTQTYTLTVSENNRKLKFTSVPVTEVEEQKKYTYAVTVFDPDGDNISIAAVEKAGWMNFSDNGDGTAVLSGAPGADQSGSYQVILQASDGSERAKQVFNVNVEDVGRAPEINSAPRTFVKEEVLYTYNMMAGDPDGGNISFKYASGPGWLSISQSDPRAGTATLSGTPPAGKAGKYTIKIIASSGEESTTQQYTLEVGTGNAPPAFTSEPVKNVTAEHPYRYAIKAEDQEADSITFSLMAAPGFLELAEKKPVAGEAVLQGTPALSDPGEHEIIIKATDNGNPRKSTQQQFTLTVNNINAAPKITSVPGKSIRSGLRYRYVITAADKEDAINDKITFAAAGPEGEALPGFLSLNDISTEDPDIFKKALAGTPGENDIGKYQIVISARDEYGGMDTQNYTLTVTQGNRAPAFSSQPPTAVRAGSQYSYEINISDPDEDSLQYSATLSGEDRLPGWLSFNQERTPVLTGTPRESDVGEYPIVITARDNGKPAKEAVQEFTLSVKYREITEFRVFYNYPNPFQQQTRIKFGLPGRESVAMELYNTAGSLVRRMEPKKYKPGVNEILLEAGNMQSGIYIYRLITAEKIETGRMTLIR